MRDHLAYLKYTLRHKLYVLHASRELGVPLWRALVHDASKFLPSEWLSYVKTFYAPDGSRRYVETLEFNQAWNHHQKRNKHHWQYWLLTMDSGTTEPMPMPETYVREMIADWAGAGRAITGKADPKGWYEKNHTKMVLHPSTRARVEALIGFPLQIEIDPALPESVAAERLQSRSEWDEI